MQQDQTTSLQLQNAVLIGEVTGIASDEVVSSVVAQKLERFSTRKGDLEIRLTLTESKCEFILILG